MWGAPGVSTTYCLRNSTGQTWVPFKATTNNLVSENDKKQGHKLELTQHFKQANEPIYNQ